MNINIQDEDLCALKPKKEEGDEEGGDQKIDHDKRDFLKMTAISAGALCGIYTLEKAAFYMAPSQDAIAGATTEVDISNLKPGESMTVVWRGKPVFIRNRTSEEIQEAKQNDSENLRDKQTDQSRTKPGKENILVVIGICTHLGCVPIGKSNVFNGGEFGGWFCPCHGSHYDIAGRIRKGPAPTNLEIPPYKFISETKILIGEA